MYLAFTNTDNANAQNLNHLPYSVSRLPHIYKVSDHKLHLPFSASSPTSTGNGDNLSPLLYILSLVILLFLLSVYL